MSKKYYLVDGEALPKVFLQVAQAKELLITGQAQNMSQAARLAGISRSAFYKYKDHIFDVGQRNTTITLNARLKDQPGALQKLLSVLSDAGCNIAFVSQVASQDGIATVSLVCRTNGMVRSMDEVMSDISSLPEVLDVQRALEDLTDIIN